jgi:hypothetical protein
MLQNSPPLAGKDIQDFGVDSAAIMLAFLLGWD